MKITNKTLSPIKLLLGVIVSFAQALFAVAWGIAGFLLLLGLTKYYEIEVPNTSAFFYDMARFIFNYVNWFVLAFFLYYLINDLNTYYKTQKEVI